MLCAYFYCWFVCIFQNIHEIEKEYVFSSSKDAKSKRGVMILMNSNTCQFEMFGENKWKDGFVYMLSFNDSKLQTFLPLLLKVGYWVWIIDNPSTWNIIKLEVFFIVVVVFFLIFHCFLICLWSLIPLPNIWSLFPLSPSWYCMMGVISLLFSFFSYFIGFK